MKQWQLYVLFAVGVIGIIFEIGFQNQIRPLALATDLVLIGILPVDVLIKSVKSHNGHNGSNS